MNKTQYIKYLDDLYKSGKERSIPNISPQNAKYILSILKENNVKTMLEIGCANGYSSLHWAFYLKSTYGVDGILHTIDLSKPMFEEAFKHIFNCKLNANVYGYLGNALHILSIFKNNLFNAIFIDAQKKNTLNFLKLSLPLLAKGGIIIIDDVIKYAYKMEELFEYIEDNNFIYSIINTDEDDGILILENNFK